eukprot:3203899-Rhodomonas_salina.7
MARAGCRGMKGLLSNSLPSKAERDAILVSRTTHCLVTRTLTAPPVERFGSCVAALCMAALCCDVTSHVMRDVTWRRRRSSERSWRRMRRKLQRKNGRHRCESGRAG